MKSKRTGNNSIRRFDARYFAGLYDYGYVGYDTVHGNGGES